MEHNNVISQMKEQAKSEVVKACNKYNYLSKLEKMSKYFQSQDWKDRKTRNLDEAHKYADVMLSQFTPKYFIYDVDRVTHGDSKLVSEMTCDEKADLDRVESQKIEYPVKSGRYLFQYIGTTVTVPGTEQTVTVSEQGVEQTVEQGLDTLPEQTEETAHEIVQVAQFR